jgi:hypothetical protein
MKNRVRNFNSFIKEEVNESRRQGVDSTAQKKIESGLLALINSDESDDMMSEDEFMRIVNRIAKDYYGHVADMRRF